MDNIEKILKSTNDLENTVNKQKYVKFSICMLTVATLFTILLYLLWNTITRYIHYIVSSSQFLLNLSFTFFLIIILFMITYTQINHLRKVSNNYILYINRNLTNIIFKYVKEKFKDYEFRLKHTDYIYYFNNEGVNVSVNLANKIYHNAILYMQYLPFIFITVITIINIIFSGLLTSLIMLIIYLVIFAITLIIFFNSKYVIAVKDYNEHVGVSDGLLIYQDKNNQYKCTLDEADIQD